MGADCDAGGQCGGFDRLVCALAMVESRSFCGPGRPISELPEIPYPLCQVKSTDYSIRVHTAFCAADQFGVSISPFSASHSVNADTDMDTDLSTYAATCAHAEHCGHLYSVFCLLCYKILGSDCDLP